MDGVKIYGSDTYLEVIEAYNTLLKPHGLELEDDGEYHDGYAVIRLKVTAPPAALPVPPEEPGLRASCSSEAAEAPPD